MPCIWGESFLDYSISFKPLSGMILFGGGNCGFDIMAVYINIDLISYIHRWGLWWWDTAAF